jgi:methionyl-tRNA formyltransferase
LKLAVLTSRSLRHHFYLDALARRHELAAVVREAKRDLVRASAGDASAVMRAHLAERDDAERRYFGAHEKPAGERVLDVAPGEANAPEVFALLRECDPELVLIFGTSIIEPPILSHYEGRIVNLHLGLSPYYRGAASNFWPLVNAEPECVGATIHHAIRKVDAGALLHQVRPELAVADGAHDVGCKAVMAGVVGVVALLACAERAALPAGRSQMPGEGAVYRRRDFSADAVRRLHANLDAGMIADYLAAKTERDAKRPVVELAELVELDRGGS